MTDPKPGDVGMVTVQEPEAGNVLPAFKAVFTKEGHWQRIDDDMWPVGDFRVIEWRPLVVIDPMDVPQVIRFARALEEFCDQQPIRRGSVGNALLSMLGPPPCTAVLTQRGQRFVCDDVAGHSGDHECRRFEASWRGPE